MILYTYTYTCVKVLSGQKTIFSFGMKTLAPAKRAPQTVMTVNIYKHMICVNSSYTVLHIFTHVLHVKDVFVPDGEDEENGKDGAADEGHVPRQDGGQRGHEDVHVVGGGLVSAGQSHH